MEQAVVQHCCILYIPLLSPAHYHHHGMRNHHSQVHVHRRLYSTLECEASKLHRAHLMQRENQPLLLLAISHTSVLLRHTWVVDNKNYFIDLRMRMKKGACHAQTL